MDPVSTLIQSMGQCRVLDSAQLEEVRQTLLPRYASDPRGLASELLQRNWVTPFQINRLSAVRGPELLQGSYVLLERIGEGGMGQVFKARNWKLGRIVALKLIRKDLLTNPTVVGRFRREIEATAQLDHPNLIRAFDADQTDDGLFIVMEYVEGIDFGRLIKEQGPVSTEKACDYVRQAALGLQHAHERGLVHRDIKPPNLLRANQGEVIKILDLGLARLQETEQLFNMHTSPGLTVAGVIVGTIDFMAPEQSRDSRTVDIRADLYSLGCTFVYMLTGKVPYPVGTPTEKLIKHNVDPLPSLLEVAPPVRAIIHKLLAKKPQDRYQTPADLVAALEQIQGNPEKMRLHLSAEMLAPTVPTISLERPKKLAGPSTPPPRSRKKSKPRMPRPSGLRRKVEPPPNGRVATAILEAAPPQAIPVGVVAPVAEAVPLAAPPKPRRRFRTASRLCLFLGLIVLAAILAWPLVFPAKATHADHPPSKPVEEVVQPVPKAWDGVVREFLILGPVGRFSDIPLQVADNSSPDATYRNFGDTPLRWRAHKADAKGALKVSPGPRLQRPYTLFAQVQVFSKTAQNVTMKAGAADAAVVKINGKQVLDTNLAVHPNPRWDDYKKEGVALKPGWNAVLVRLGARGNEDFEFYLAFEGKDLRVALRPEKPTR
jgi:serine/threonine protein kinase